jgi:SAM-dependent methyltransferase
LRDGEGRTLLDIGCGNGAFAEFAASRGFQVVGLDVDFVSIAIARSRNIPGARFYCSSLDEFCGAEIQDGQFDVVTMFEIFEHLDHPTKTLGSVMQLLRDGGLLVGSLPNIKRLFMWRLNMDYEMPPYHLTYWTVESWVKFLQRYFDFDVMQCEANIYYGYLSDVLLTRFKLSRLTRAVIARIVFPVEVRLEKRFRMGASFYFEARRQSIQNQDRLSPLRHPINMRRAEVGNERTCASQ